MIRIRMWHSPTHMYQWWTVMQIHGCSVTQEWTVTNTNKNLQKQQLPLPPTPPTPSHPPPKTMTIPLMAVDKTMIYSHQSFHF